MQVSSTVLLIGICLCCEVSISLALNDGASYTCGPTISLCPHTIVECFCTISSTAVLYNQWNLTYRPSCEATTTIESLLQLKHTGTQCSKDEQQLGTYIKAFNVNACTGEDCVCETSSLRIQANPCLHGMIFECLDGTNESRSVLKIIFPPNEPNISRVYSLNPTELTVEWLPASNGDHPNTFNITIVSKDSNNTSTTAAIIADENSHSYMHSFTGLTSDSTYTVSVISINCAGSSQAAYKTGLKTDNAVKEGLIYGGTAFLGLTLVAVVCSITVWCKCKKKNKDDQLLPKTSRRQQQKAHLKYTKPTLRLLHKLEWIDDSGQRNTLNIVQRCSQQYENLGMYLLKDDNQEIVSSLAMKNNHDPSKTTEDVFKRWINERNTATWENLLQTLNDIGLRALADDIDDALKAIENIA